MLEMSSFDLAVAASGLERRGGHDDPLAHSLREAMTTRDTPEAPRSVAGMEWPARCLVCGFLTEDPDAYGGDDEELMPDETLCRTGTFHRWAPATRDTPEAARIALHAVVCRERPDRTEHSFVFDPQGILSDCRYLAALDGWTLVPKGPISVMVEMVTADNERMEAEIARLQAALKGIRGEAEEVALGQHGDPLRALDAIVERCHAALAPEIPHG